MFSVNSHRDTIIDKKVVIILISFFIVSCWMSSANNLIWIFVAFVVMIEGVSDHKTNIKSPVGSCFVVIHILHTNSNSN